MNIKGAVGPQGPQGIQGEVGPQGLQGLQGLKGNDGSTWYTGEGTPAANATLLAASEDGDLFLDILTANVYVKASGSWGVTPLVNIKGAQGPQGIQGIQGEIGPQGPQGLQGNDGSTWYTGSGDPGTTATDLSGSANGDLYLDTATANVYVRALGSWGATPLVNIRGPAGANGATWFVGTGDPDGGIGAVGDFYLDAANSAIWKKFPPAADWDFQYYLTAASTGASIAFTVNPIEVLPPEDITLSFSSAGLLETRVFSGSKPLVVSTLSEGLDYQWYLDGTWYTSGTASVTLTDLKNGTHWIFLVVIPEGEDSQSSATYSFQISSEGAPL
ncbi:MAG: hypothetical protein Q8M76_13440 [Spirochaetaceae bacterium]|nr:hypothetical protein [Spirochaetaceae bacterium]